MDEAEVATRELIVEVMHDEESVTISVSDNGVGIPPESLPKIFSHGFTTKAEGHGFGLHHARALQPKHLGCMPGGIAFRCFQQGTKLRLGWRCALSLVDRKRAAHRADRLPDGQADTIEVRNVGQPRDTGIPAERAGIIQKGRGRRGACSVDRPRQNFRHSP